MRVIDVMHLGRPHVIGCWEVDGALVDPGPESSMETLLEAIGDEQPRALLLTHIHLDHAAATGALVRRWPELEVYVHERGARHLIDPSKLLASAERLYGDQMERLWGEIVPVPEANVKPLAGGEDVLGMRVAYTPGHASHHVCYFHEESGTAFVGDVAAVRIPRSTWSCPPLPRPTSTSRPGSSRSRSSSPGAPSASPSPTSARSRSRSSTSSWCAGACARRPTWPASSRGGVRAPPPRARSRRSSDPEAAEELIQCVPPQYQWRGLDRYWEKRAEREAAG